MSSGIVRSSSEMQEKPEIFVEKRVLKQDSSADLKIKYRMCSYSMITLIVYFERVHFPKKRLRMQIVFTKNTIKRSIKKKIRVCFYFVTTSFCEQEETYQRVWTFGALYTLKRQRIQNLCGTFDSLLRNLRAGLTGN